MEFQFDNETVNRLNNELAIASKLNNLHLYKLVWTLLLIHEKQDYKEVASLLRVSERTVYNRLKRFIVEGFSWLCGHHFQGRGRKPRLSKAQKQKLYDLIVAGPQAAGFDCGIWTSGLILELIQREFKVTFNPRYLCELLKKIGLSYQKAKFVTDKIDEGEYQQKRKEWEEVTWPSILKQAKTLKAVILFGDEVSFAQWGSLAHTWAPIGKQPTVKTSGKRKGMKIFGAIEFQNGGFHYMENEGKFNSGNYVMFLKQVLSQYACPVILIEDGAPYHKGVANAFKEKMRQEGQLFVHRLPSYSPDYNPIEKLWKNTKKEATHLKYFPTFESLRETVIRTFNSFMENALKIVCVMQKLRTQAGIA